MASHTDMRARHESAQKELAPIAKVVAQVLLLFLGKHREPGQRVAMAAAHFWRQAPDAATSGPQLRRFFLGEFQNAVGRVGADGVKRMGGAMPQPFKAVRLFDPIQSLTEYQTD